LLCDINMSVRYSVKFTDDGSIEMVRETDEDMDNPNEQEAIWICAAKKCGERIFDGTKEQLIEYLLCKDKICS